MYKRNTKIFAWLLVLAIISGCFGTALATALPGSDVEGLACEEAVGALVDYSVVSKYPDGSFRPENPITRAETAKMLAVAGGFRFGSGLGAGSFADTKGHWAEGFIALCQGEDILNGYSDGTFRPQGLVTYNEICAMLIRALGYTDSVLEGTYPDSYVSKAAELGIIGDVSDMSANASRADVAVMLWAAIQLPLVTVEAGEFINVGENETLASHLETQRIYNDSAILRGFTLAGYYENNTINQVTLTDSPAAYIWNADMSAFYKTEATAENIIYNYVAVCDTNADKTGDTLFIVKRADSAKYWNENAIYTDPRAASDSAYAGTFSNPYNIPYGARLIETADKDGFLSWSGAGVDYRNIVAPGDLDASTYYPIYDWYNTQSAGTLTFLSGFKTLQQSNGWACGVTSATMVMDWYGLRGDLNELDLAALRDKKDADGQYVWGGGTDTQMLINAFTGLNKMEDKKVWNWTSTYDFVDKDGNLSEDYLSTAWIQSTLAEGKPILIGWNSFGGHWQVIIGYDSMGTETVSDDVLILADPYDTTDHRNDGYNIQSYERFYWDWTQTFDRDFSAKAGYGMPVIFVPYPADYDASSYKPDSGKGLAVTKGSVWNTEGSFTDDMLIDYGKTAADLTAAERYKYSNQGKGENGLAGPASSDYYRKSDVKKSPYYPSYDFFVKDESLSSTLSLLDSFKTSQQASEWTCGPSSLRMVLNWFGILGNETEFSLAAMRKNDVEGATTLDGMVQMLEALNKKNAGLGWVTTDDLDEDDCIGGYGLYDGAADGGLIPYCIENNIPVIIGWNEWGGHWQVIIGYDDMGTPETQDDVLILADPYDTTDHNQDGYVVESFERLVYGWGANFDERGGEVFVICAPLAELAAAGLK
ncbi:MAG: S-layer homology domain-containing protein [Oscillospiraceae bacterium]|jgi:hypothetical protein|nr:S-layer homology domain-containing protein [Oscillospiraceae bacterium]